MSKRIDLTGQKFGRLTVTEYSHTHDGCAFWKCICDCGNIVVVRSRDLRSGRTKSCGCLHKEAVKKMATTHGLCHDRLFSIWCAMRRRCTDPKYKFYHNYGGRGITVCEEWKNNFQAFYDWAKANGYRDDLSIDRIDVDGNYCPENCRWATMIEQANNKRNNHLITYNGKTLTMAEWSRKIGVSYQTLKDRINYHGWSIERALTTPPKTCKK